MLKLLVPIVALAAMVGFTFMSDRQLPPADFVFINRGDVNTLDLQRMSWMQDLRVARMIYEGLVETDVFTWEQSPRPAGATSWDISEDKRTYTFHLRPASTWSNGDPVTSAHYLYTWRRALLPDTASDYVNFFWLIEGGKPFYDWRKRALSAFSAYPFSASPDNPIAASDEPEQTAAQLVDVIWYHAPQADAPHSDRPSPVSEAHTQSLHSLSETLTQLTQEIETTNTDLADAQGTARTPLKDTLTNQRAAINDAFADHATAITALRDAFAANPFTPEQLWDETVRMFDKMVAVKAPDAHTFIVTLTNPTPYFIDLCAFPVLFPVYPDLVQQYEKFDPASGRIDTQLGWTKPGKLITNGPFLLTSWRFKRDMYFEPNPHYWNTDRLNLDTIQILSVEDPNASVLAFDNGSVDWLSSVTPTYRADMLEAKHQFYAEHQAQYDQLKAQGLDPVAIDRQLPPDPRKNIHAFASFGTYFYNFNCNEKLPDGRDNPFHDPRVRRAFTMAVNKDRIVNEIKRVGEPVATTFVPPNSIGNYNSPKGLPFDPEAARAELAAAGYPNGRGLITVSILFNKDAGHDIIAQAIKNDWETHLGVKVILEQKEMKVYRNDLKSQNYMISRGGWYGDYGDPTTFLDLNRSTDGNNDRKYNNPEYDTLLDKAATEPDPDQRLRYLEQAEAIVCNQDVPLLPIFHYTTIYLFDPHRVSGITPHPRLTQNMYLADILTDDKGSNTPLSLPPKQSSTDDSLLGDATR